MYFDHTIVLGDITLGQAATVMPFSNAIDIVELYGRHLLQALEHSVSTHGTPLAIKFGGFLQISGAKLSSLMFEMTFEGLAAVIYTDIDYYVTFLFHLSATAATPFED